MFRRILGVILSLIIIAILLLGVKDLPRYGEENSPVNNEVSRRYIDKGMEETGAKNIVAGVILDYRAFDTFVEASVLFTSIIIIISVMKKDSKVESDENE
ncbi:MAG: hypothetical protein Q4P31_04770 [Andreesenia angusta]|nr:hypothetical protein [Andreesenia angusta]